MRLKGVRMTRTLLREAFMIENTNIREIKGIGEKSEALFHKLKIYTVYDLLTDYPRTYTRYPEITRDMSIVQEGKKAAFEVTIARKPATKKGRIAVTILRQEAAGNIPLECIWFRLPYLSSTLKIGDTFVFYGTVKKGEQAGFVRLEQPEIHPLEKYSALLSSLQPVYSLTKGLSNTLFKKSIETALVEKSRIVDFLPAAILSKHDLPDLYTTFSDTHFPADEGVLTRARRRLSFDDFFFFFLSLSMNEEKEEVRPNTHIPEKTDFYTNVRQSLPYPLTKGQEKALSDIFSDFHQETISERLIQGDVGSGKTLVAFLSMLLMVENGYKALLMAPTEVLAEQHYKTFCHYIDEFLLPFQAVLLTGAVKGKARKEALETIASSAGLFVIGTSALISEAREYGDIGIVVTDEQHRFGVKQRKALMNKGASPYVLLLSATPIPRTLAKILYQDMPISVMADKPASRLPIKNCVVGPDKRLTSWKFLEKQVREGRQAYVICPFVEQSEEDPSIADVETYSKELKKALPKDIRIGTLHGRMKDSEKEEVMASFGAHETDILVSTTVIEVGIDVPNATVILIENADRFGLSQLHQLRGRVGRGKEQSYCIFMNCADGNEIPERLKSINSSNDGFFIAEEDLRLRGPGDVTGIRQSGEAGVDFTEMAEHPDVMAEAAEEAKEVLKKDPKLESLEYRAIASHLQKMEEKQIFKNL